MSLKSLSPGNIVGLAKFQRTFLHLYFQDVKGLTCVEKVCSQIHLDFRLENHFWGRFWDPIGASFGALFGSFWTLLGSLGTSWGALGAPLVPFWTSFGLSGVPLGSFWYLLGVFLSL